MPAFNKVLFLESVYTLSHLTCAHRGFMNGMAPMHLGFFHKSSCLEKITSITIRIFMIDLPKDGAPWWKIAGGLQFSCTGCGRCCSGEPGVVWLTEKEAGHLATRFDLSLEIFERRFCRIVDGRLALREVRRPREGQWGQFDHDCVFLQGGKLCTVYEQRPMQCRTFPFWPEVLANPTTWEGLSKRGCEGLAEEAELVSSERIEEQLAMTAKCPGFGHF
jgi:Fe-S-cluster containining protein